ncbi:MAG TPA: hypothetical protein VE571_15080 [Solirubrobacteraceae bacterium]|nr:hypothetical protein [Solirubrobacteraceae bacterium]
MAVARLALESQADAAARVSDEVELYQRTYTTLLRSSGETHLRVLEPSHRAIGSSLHPLAASDELDLGAFLYAIRRLPEGIVGARLVAMAQEVEAFVGAGMPVQTWQEAEAAARRRRWYDDGAGTLAVLLASASDVDDLLPTLVAFQIEWNKLRVRQRAAGWLDIVVEREPASEECAALLGGTADDWGRLKEAWGERFGDHLRLIASERLALRIRMFGGSHTGYARLTRRWWAPVSAELDREGLTERPLYFVSSNTHSLINIATPVARDREAELVAFVESMDEDDILRQELARFREGRTEGSWENFLYFVARIYFAVKGAAGKAERRAAEQASGVTHLRSATGLRVPAQIVPLGALKADGLDPRVGDVDAEALAASDAVIVNIDYPLGVAAYNILREVAVDRAALRGVYVLGKAATLNADVGDVMISSVVHDEHSGSTYWLDNAFSVDDLAGDLRFGTGLDNQRAVTVKSTFLQNRSYLDFYYREAYTVVEMEAGPFCDAVYEMADADRHPVGEAVNFSKLPIDLGIIHYASDTPYTQARTLGARGLSYYGMDSTYAGSLAILRRVLLLEGVVSGRGRRATDGAPGGAVGGRSRAGHR